MKDNFKENLDKTTENIKIIHSFLCTLQSDDNFNYHEQNIELVQNELLAEKNINEIRLEVEDLKGITKLKLMPLLHLAAHINDIETAKALLEQKVNIDAQDNVKATALHRAALKGHLEIVKFLIESKADIGAKEINNLTMLHYATISGNNSVVDLFLNLGINIEAVDSNNETALHYAVDCGRMQTVEFLLNHKANIESKNQDGRTPIYYAVGNAHGIMIKLLLKHNANIDSVDSSNITLLQGAAKGGFLEQVKLLLENKANIEANTGRYNFTALHRASISGYLEVVEFLLMNNAKVHALCDTKKTALHWAAFTNHLPIIELLVQYQSDINIKDASDRNALHYAALKDHFEISDFLIKQGIEINAIDSNKDTPLCNAAKKGHLQITKLLIENNAEIEVTNAVGITPLQLALAFAEKDNDYAKIVEAILDVKPEMASSSFKSDEDQVCSLLELAAESGSDSLIDNILTKSSKLINSYGLNSLKYAASKEHVSTATKLLSKLLEVNRLGVVTDNILMPGNMWLSQEKDPIKFKSTFCIIAADFIVQNFSKPSLSLVNQDKNFMNMLKISQKVDRELLIDIFNKGETKYSPCVLENMKQSIAANYFTLKRVAHKINEDAPIASIVKYSNLMSYMLDFIEEGSLWDAEYDAPLLARQIETFNENNS